MSASDIDGRKIRIDVSRYAPPRYRTPAGEASSGPALERLSRGESEDGSERPRAQAVPPVEPIHPQGASPKMPLSMTGRLAVAMALFAGLAVVSTTLLQSKAEHPATTVTTEKAAAKATARKLDAPKTVHTVAFRPQAATVGQSQSTAIANRPVPSPARPASLADRAAGVAPQHAPPRTATALALTAPLKMWAMFPDEPSAAADASAKQPAADSPTTDRAKEAAAKPTHPASRHKAARTAKAAKHVRRHRRHYAKRRTRRRHTRTAAAKPSPAQQAAPAQAQASTQPLKKNPIQAALDKLFGNGGGSASDTASDSAVPVTTGAAFR